MELVTERVIFTTYGESTEASSGSETSSTKTSSSPTGDHTNAVGYAVLLMSALVLMILILEKNHRKA